MCTYVPEKSDAPAELSRPDLPESWQPYEKGFYTYVHIHFLQKYSHAVETCIHYRLNRISTSSYFSSLPGTQRLLTKCDAHYNSINIVVLTRKLHMWSVGQAAPSMAAHTKSCRSEHIYRHNPHFHNCHPINLIFGKSQELGSSR